MSLPNGHKAGGVSSLIRMFQEKERLEHSDSQKLKPRSSLDPSTPHTTSRPLTPSPSSTLPSRVPPSTTEQPSVVDPAGDIDTAGIASISPHSEPHAGQDAAATHEVGPDLAATGTLLEPSTTAVSNTRGPTEPENTTISKADTEVKEDRGPASTAVSNPIVVRDAPSAATAVTPKKPAAKQQTAAREHADRATPTRTPKSSRPQQSRSGSPALSSASAAIQDETSSADPVRSPPRRAGFMAPTASSAARAASNSRSTSNSNSPVRKSVETPRKATASTSKQKASSASRSPLSTRATLAREADRSRSSPSPSPGQRRGCLPKSRIGSTATGGPNASAPTRRGDAPDSEPSESGQSGMTLGEDESISASVQGSIDTLYTTSASGKSEAAKAEDGADTTEAVEGVLSRA